MRALTVSYMALIDSLKLNLQAGDDAEDVQWFVVQQTVLETTKEKTDNGYIKVKLIELTSSIEKGWRLTMLALLTEG